MIRNNTSFPLQITAKLKQFYDAYVKETENFDENFNKIKNTVWSKILKYYQFLIRELISNSSFTETEYARGLLIYHDMGMGKTRLAVSVVMSIWDIHQPIILLPQGLKKNFKKTIKEVVDLLNSMTNSNALSYDEALIRFKFISMDAYNSATQLSSVKGGNSFDSNMTEFTIGGSIFSNNSLDNKLLIVDEAHNFFRAIINSADENSNARKIYNIIMSAKNLKILFLTGTPCSKDAFELVPCFNMLTGTNLLPTSYEIFYNLYVDKVTKSIINRNKLANRLMGLVSYIRGGTTKLDKKSNQNLFPEKKELIISYVEMGPIQYKQYLLAREKEDAEKSFKKEDGTKGSMLDKRINATPLALPGSEKKTLGSYYVKSRILSTFSPPREYRDSPIDDIPLPVFTEQNGPKLYLIATRAKEAKGSVLVYSQFIDKGGLKPLTKYLENKGFKEFII